MKSQRNKKDKENKVYDIGDEIFIKVHVRKGLNYKLAEKFLGPFKIIEFLQANKIRVQNTEDEEDIRVVSLSQIRM